MKRRKAGPLFISVVIGYVLLLFVVVTSLSYPWNLAVALLLLLKGTIFAAILLRAAKIGTGRSHPPR